jgi:hypothetical protein
MAARGSKRRRWKWYGLFVAPSFVGLACVLVAIGRGQHGLWPVAGFLALWAVAAAYVTIAGRALRRRAQRLRSAPVPRGTCLSTPVWILVEKVMTIAGVVGMLGTVVAALGFPGIAVGVLIVIAGMLAISMLPGFGVMDIRGLTFEETGLRFHIGASSCLVPWTSISEVEPIGPDHYQMVRLVLGRDWGSALETVSPDTPRTRARFQGTFDQAYVLLDHWAAGLDGQTLARAIAEAKAGEAEQTN